jgi:hypothetical protein
MGAVEAEEFWQTALVRRQRKRQDRAKQQEASSLPAIPMCEFQSQQAYHAAIVWHIDFLRYFCNGT